MIQASRSVRFLLETAEPFGVGDDCAGQDLDRDIAPQAWIARAIDLGHAVCSDKRDDLVRAEPCSGCQHPQDRSGQSPRRGRVSQIIAPSSSACKSPTDNC
jgi:hypothetical protein